MRGTALVNLLLPRCHLWLSILLSQLTNTRVFYLGGKLFILIWFFKDELIMKYNLPAVSKEKPESSEQKVCYRLHLFIFLTVDS